MEAEISFKTDDGTVSYSKQKLIKHSTMIKDLLVDSDADDNTSIKIDWAERRIVSIVFDFIDLLEQHQESSARLTYDILQIEPLPPMYTAFIDVQTHTDMETLLKVLKFADFLYIEKIKLCIVRYLDLLTRENNEDAIRKICVSTLTDD